MRALKLIVSLAFAGALAAPAHAQEFCGGRLSAQGLEMKPGELLRFGVTPSGAAGQLGPVPAAFAPDQPDRILGALKQLAPPDAPFVTHMYTSWRNEGPTEDARLLELAHRYAGAGYLVEVVVRYHPAPEREGDIEGYAAFVRRMVGLLGPIKQVVAFQIANEVNFTASPDSSDGAFAGARDAIVAGVIAGHDEARKLGHTQLEMGFNWLFRLDPGSEQQFWDEIRDKGGAPFIAALRWLGLDAYPGTFYPPVLLPGQERDFMVDALETLRCYSGGAGIPERIPIHVQETGYPTGPGRTEERQLQMVENLVGALHDFRGTFNVSDMRWFNLRDAETASLNFQQHYGLLRDDYSPKPAFDAFKRLVAQHSIRNPPVAPARPRLALRIRCERGRLKVRITGADRRRVRSSNRSVKRLRSGRMRVRVVAKLRDGRRATLVRTVRACVRRSPRR